MSAPTRVLGFDPGLVAPAFAELDMKGKLIRVQVVNDKKAIDANVDCAWRAHHIAAVIIREVVATGSGTCLVGIEGPAYGYKNSSSMDQLARCRQAIYDACANHLEDFIYFDVPPRVRLTAIGLKGNLRGKELKAAVVAQIQRIYRVNLNQRNKSVREAEADAIAVAAATHGLWKRKITL